jgi:hypothetical protein
MTMMLGRRPGAEEERLLATKPPVASLTKSLRRITQSILS